MSRPRPMFPFYGAKWRATPKYPLPLEGSLIVEPFAGSACYALHHHEGHAVHINDANETIVGIWKYLQKLSKSEKLLGEFLRLPVNVNTIHDKQLKSAPQEAKDLIGFWFTKAARPAEEKVGWARQGSPSYKASYAKQYWSEERRARIAEQVPFIRDWKITLGDYRNLDNKKATWFVDPPYEGGAGKAYESSNEGFDYGALYDWCDSRKGLLIACESNKQTWGAFEFSHFGSFKSVREKKHVEMIWTKAA